MTQLAGSPALLMGSQGGWIVNHHFVLGGGGYGTVSDLAMPRGGVDQDVSLGYGGVRRAFIIGDKDDRFHFGGAALGGAGGVDVGGSSTVAWVFEPELDADVSVVRWLRVGISGGYRLMGPTSDNGAKVSFAQLSGATAGLQLKFGSF